MQKFGCKSAVWFVSFGTLPVLSLLGCFGKGPVLGPFPDPAPVTPPATASVYVIQNPATFGAGSGYILRFPASSSGAATPDATILAPAGTSFNGLGTDGSGNVYVTANSPTTLDLREYSHGATGTPAPMRVLPSDSTTKMYAPNGIDVTANGEMYVAEDTGGVAHYGASATGSVAPSTYVLGASETGGGLSTLILADAVAADTMGNLYVVNQGTSGFQPICVFSSTDTGNVAPLRTIGGDKTTIGFISGITTDDSGALYVADSISDGQGNVTDSILVFSPAASGNVPPVRTISGSATGLTGRLGGVKLDSAGNLYVIVSGRSGQNPSVVKFPSQGDGNVVPLASFTSLAWTNPDNELSLAVH